MQQEPQIHFVLLAAGSGSRFGGEKTLVQLGGIPLFMHSFRRFMPLCDTMTLVVSAQRVDEYRAICEKECETEQKLHVIAGGASRTESVSNALNSLSERGFADGLVAIHDAARPFASAETFSDLCQKAIQFGGAIPADPLTDTLLHADDAMLVDGAIPRENAWRVATPQVFDLKALNNAYALAATKSYTDDAQVLRAAGGKVAIVRQREFNIKITYPQDIILAQAILEHEKTMKAMWE